MGKLKSVIVALVLEMKNILEVVWTKFPHCSIILENIYTLKGGDLGGED